MQRLIPPQMIAWTLWAAWGLLLGGAVVWLLVGAVSYWIKQGMEPGDVPAWVQAIGALLTILGAAAFPYMHESVRQKQKLEGLRKVLLLLAKNQQEQLRLLHSTLANAVMDFGEHTINPYLQNGWHLKWPPHLEALSAIPISELDPGQVHMLGELKVAARFAASVIDRLDGWNVIGDSEAADIAQLKHYHMMATLTVELLEQHR